MTVIGNESRLRKAPPFHVGYAIDCAGARLSVRARSLATVLSVEGEIDASNNDRLADAINHFSQLETPLVLDLSGVGFLGVSGFRALMAFDEQRACSGSLWALVIGDALRPFLRVVADHQLPVASSIGAALQDIEADIRARRGFLMTVAAADAKVEPRE